MSSLTFKQIPISVWKHNISRTCPWVECTHRESKQTNPGYNLIGKLSFNTLKPEQNVRRSANTSFKRTSFNENLCISSNGKAALIQILASRWECNKLLLEPILSNNDEPVSSPSIHWADGRLTVRSREVSKPRDWGLVFYNRSVIWQARRQQRCRDVCQISERHDHYNVQSRSFETSRDRPSASWIEALTHICTPGLW